MTEVTKEQKEWLLENKFIEENTSEEDIVKAFEKHADDWKKYLGDKLKEAEANLEDYYKTKYEKEKNNIATEQNDGIDSKEFQEWKKDYIEKHPDDKEVQKLVEEIERIKSAIDALEKNQPQVQATQQAQDTQQAQSQQTTDQPKQDTQQAQSQQKTQTLDDKIKQTEHELLAYLSGEFAKDRQQYEGMWQSDEFKQYVYNYAASEEGKNDETYKELVAKYNELSEEKANQQKAQTAQRQVNLHGYTKEEIIAFAENYAVGKAELMPMGWYNFVEAINGLGNDIPDDKKASIDTAKNKAMAEIGVFEEYFGLDKMQSPDQIAKNMEHLDTLLKEMDLSGGKTKPKYEINEPAKDNTVNFQGMNLEYVVSKLQRSDLKPEDRAKLIQMAANYVNSDKFANVKFDRGSTEGKAKVLGNNEWLLELLKSEKRISDDVFNKKKEHLERKKAAFEEAVFNKQDYNEELDNANALLDRIVFTRPKHLNKAFGIKGEEKEYNEKYQQKLKELFKEQVKQEVYIHLANTLPEGEITKEKFEEEYALRLQSKILGLQGIDEFYKTGGEKTDTEEQIKKLLGNEKIVINSRALASFQAGSTALTSKAISLMQGRKGFEKIAEKLNERNKKISYEASNLHGVWISTAISSLKSVGWMGLYSLVGKIPNGIGIAAVSGVTFAMQVTALVKDVKAKKQEAEAKFEKLTFRKYLSENKLRIGGLLLSGTSTVLSTASIFCPPLIPIRTAVMYTGGALLGAGTIRAAVKAAPKGKKLKAFFSSLMVTASSYTGMALGLAMADNQAQPADTDSATNPGNTVSNESRGFFDNILDNVKGWLGNEKPQEQQLSDVKGDEQTRIVNPLDKEKAFAANVVEVDTSNVEVAVENIETTQNTETKYGDLTRKQMIRMFRADNSDVVSYLKDNHVIAADVTEFGESKLIALLDSGQLQNHYEALSGIYENNFYENGSIKPDSWLNDVYPTTTGESVNVQDETINNNTTIPENGQGGVATAPYADNSSQPWHNPNFDPTASDANPGYDVTFTDNNLEVLRDEKGLYKQYTFDGGETDQQDVKVYANGDKEVTQYKNGKPYFIDSMYTMENGVKVVETVPAPGSDFVANEGIVHDLNYESPDNIKITVQEHTNGSISIMMNDTNNGSARSETYVNGELTEAKYYDPEVARFVKVENPSPDSKIVELLGENHPASQGLDGSALEIDQQGQPNDNNTTVDPSVNNLSDDFKAKLPNDSHVVKVETVTGELGKTTTTIHTENGIFVDFGNNDMTGIAVVDGELKVYDEGGLVDYNPENEAHKTIVDNCQTLLGEEARELSTTIDKLQIPSDTQKANIPNEKIDENNIQGNNLSGDEGEKEKVSNITTRLEEGVISSIDAYWNENSANQEYQETLNKRGLNNVENLEKMIRTYDKTIDGDLVEKTQTVFSIDKADNGYGMTTSKGEVATLVFGENGPEYSIGTIDGETRNMTYDEAKAMSNDIRSTNRLNAHDMITLDKALYQEYRDEYIADHLPEGFEKTSDTKVIHDENTGFSVVADAKGVFEVDSNGTVRGFTIDESGNKTLYNQGKIVDNLKNLDYLDHFIQNEVETQAIESLQATETNDIDTSDVLPQLPESFKNTEYQVIEQNGSTISVSASGIFMTGDEGKTIGITIDENNQIRAYLNGKEQDILNEQNIQKMLGIAQTIENDSAKAFSDRLSGNYTYNSSTYGEYSHSVNVDDNGNRVETDIYKNINQEDVTKTTSYNGNNVSEIRTITQGENVHNIETQSEFNDKGEPQKTTRLALKGANPNYTENVIHANGQETSTISFFDEAGNETKREYKTADGTSVYNVNPNTGLLMDGDKALLLDGKRVEAYSINSERGEIPSIGKHIAIEQAEKALNAKMQQMGYNSI